MGSSDSNEAHPYANKGKVIEKDKTEAEAVKFDEKLKEGPIQARRCTDCWFSLVFIAFCVGIFAASIYGWVYGDPEKLLIGWDSDANGCGFSEATKDYPFLYWPEMPDEALVGQIEAGNYSEALNLLNYGVCVKKCPGSTDDPVKCKSTSYMSDSAKYADCQYYPYGLSFPPFRYESESTLDHFCLPSANYTNDDVKDAFKEAFFANVLGDQGTQYMYDIGKSWVVLLVSCFIAVAISYIYLALIRCFGGIMIWVAFVLSLLILVAGGIYTYFYARPLYDPASNTYDYLAYTSYVLWALAAILVLTMLCCFNAIQLAIAVFSCTVQFIQNNPLVFALPILTAVVTVIWTAFWLVCVVFIFSVGDPEPRPGFPFITEMMWNDNTRGVLVYHVFALLWISAFIIGSCQFIIAGSTCIWYFECKSENKGRFAIARASKWLISYHWPSIAIGSLVIAICQFIKLCFEAFRKKMAVADKTIPWVKAVLCMTGYCLWFLEKCVKMISKNAYIQIALTNNNFCTSAWHSFALIIKNAHRFGLTHTIGAVYTFFGVIVISAATSGLGYLWLTNQASLNLASPIPPTVAVAIIALMIAYQFLSIIAFSMDAVLQSYLLDEEMKCPGNNRPDKMQQFADSISKQRKTMCGCACC